MQVTEAQLRTWTTSTHFEEGKSWFESGRVEQYTVEEGKFEGRLSIRDRAQICRFELTSSGQCLNKCPCRVSRQEGLICGHVIAIMLAWRQDHADPQEEREERIRQRLELAPERRKHFRKIGDTGIPASLHLSFRRNWAEEVLKGSMHLIPTLELQSRVRRPDQLHPTQALKLGESDQHLLALLEDLAGGPLPPVFEIPVEDVVQVMQVMQNREIRILDWPAPIRINSQPVLPMLTVDLDRESGQLITQLQLDLPRPLPAGTSPLLLLSPKKGWVIGGDHAWPLESVPPAELGGLRSGPVRIPRERVQSFLLEELPRLEESMLVDNRVDMASFRTSDVSPAFHLELKGGRQFVSGVLHARYGEVQVLANGPDSNRLCSIPDPKDPLAYGGRNRTAEKAALERLGNLGFASDSGDRLGTVEGTQAIANLISRIRFEFEPQGWEVEWKGNLKEWVDSSAFLLAQVGVETTESPDWFRLDLSLRDSQGTPHTEAALRKALAGGKEFLEMGDTLVLFPRKEVEVLTEMVKEAKPGEDGSLRLPRRTCGYLQSRLEAASGLAVSTSEDWIREASTQNQELELEPVDLEPALAALLRSYQDIGVRWLRRLETGGFNGILADDMGLGKTLQTLAWLSLKRLDSETETAPALVVCPSSLVRNWAEECERFLPTKTVMPIEGAKRADLWTKSPEADLVVVSYGMLRRDISTVKNLAWSAVILDEAQHIKNPDTQNAKAAKQLQAPCRLVLTGTPMENQVRDLWSLFDFLMPGYLGSAAEFKKNISSVITQGGAGAETALDRLRRKLKPFLLRRLKQEVAPDLPPRLERRVFCDLTPAQRTAYTALESQVKTEMETAQQSGGNKLDVLKGLMRLRQLCGHPRLVPELASPPDESGKLDMFFELLNEIMDGGHRALVFSSFTSMLGLVREQLEAREISHLYLDGSTKNRQDLVHEFNDHDDIPVFLISLMAGGTGLNLTGADVVIHLDPWWNPAAEDQATDRAHRIGQERTVYAMKLITRDTVEAKVMDLQDRKRELIDAALSGDGAVMDTLNWDEIRELVSL